MNNVGNVMYNLAERLYPICRSITGNGFRQSLAIIREILPEIQFALLPGMQ